MSSHPYPTPPRSDERRVLGRPVPRIEDPPLVTGHGLFAGDVSFPHQLHMRMVRSNHAHARIVTVDTAAARALPGVVAIWTCDDTADIPPIDFRDPTSDALKPFRQPVLARGRVRYVGDPIVAVFAEDPYVAEDAADLVAVEVEELPVVLDADGALGTFDDRHDTEPTVIRYSFGDIEAAFAQADAVVELDLRIGRHSGVPLETRGAIGRYDAARDVLELHGAAKVPHRNKETLMRMLKRSGVSLHLHEGHTGGGFGIRGELYPEDLLALVAALRLRRPVKWIEDRREHLIAANHSRQQRHCVRAAVDAQGRLLGLDDVIYHDQGAYVRTHGSRVMGRTMSMLTGPYRVGALRAVGHYRLTNKTPAATYRAPGRYEGTFVRERIMDAIAQKLGIDRVEIRRRNLIAGADMPFTVAFDDKSIEELPLDSGDYPALLEKSLKHFGWDEMQRQVLRRRAAGEKVGTGVALFVEEGGRGPTDGARIAVDTSGAVEVVTGGASVGQGFETAMAQICAEALGVDYRRVRVMHGQTDRIPYGIGAHAARATVMTGGAVNETALKVREKAIAAAARLMQAAPEDLDIVDGIVVRRDRQSVAGGPSISLGDIARRLAPASDLLDGQTPGLSAEAFFHSDHTVFPYGGQFALVSVDPETGKATVERLMISYDVGRAVNPMLLDAQLVGGGIQGFGGALLEEFTYDENGAPLAVTFADYLMPTLGESPPVDVLIAEDAPSPNNPLGIKSGGEGGINAVGAVIASAIDDAIGIPGAVTQLPVTPQRLKKLLRRP